MPFQRRAVVFLLVYAAAVVYVCFYPWVFNFDQHPYPLTWLPLESRRSLLDFVLNIVLYVPLGGAACLAFGRGGRGLLLAIAIGFALSFGVEWTQRFTYRVGDLNDLTANTAGTAVGAMAALAWNRLPRTRYGDAVMLAALWVLWNGFMLLPELSHYGFPRQDSPFSWFSTVNAFAGFLALSIALRRQWTAAAILVFAPIPALLTRPSELAQRCLAAALALLLARLATPRRARGLAVALLVWLAFQEFAPFRFTAQNEFRWLPFESLFYSNPVAYYPVILEKMFLYTAIVWMMRFQGARWFWALVIPATILAAGEAAQCFLPGRSPELTDVVLITGGAFLLWLGEPLPRNLAAEELRAAAPAAPLRP